MSVSAETGTGAPALSVRGLSKRYGARRALREVSFELPQGARLAIFGPNGAGKTTLLRLLATLERPSSGEFSVLGMEGAEDAEAIRAHIGLISHQPMLYPDLTAYENLVFFGRLYGLADPGARAEELLERVELAHRAHDPVRGFSRGMVQRMALARALVNDPELVFLDEPYAGLDPHAARVVDALLSEEGGSGRPEARTRTLVTVSHQPGRDYGRATHVLLLARGKCALFGQTGSLPRDDFEAMFAAKAGER